MVISIPLIIIVGTLDQNHKVYRTPRNWEVQDSFLSVGDPQSPMSNTEICPLLQYGAFLDLAINSYFEL